MPPLHSMIVLDGSEVWLETMAEQPPVLVNGRAQTSVRLAENDHIQIGPFEFLAHCAAAPPAEAEPPVAVSPTAPATNDAEPEIRELSAAALIERIEAATRLVEEFERRERLGMEALLHSLGHRAEGIQEKAELSSSQALIPMPRPATAASDETEARMLNDLESLVVQLSAVVHEMQKQSSAQRRREAGHAQAVTSLLEIQDRLSRQFESLLQQVASHRRERSFRELNRAIA